MRIVQDKERFRNGVELDYIGYPVFDDERGRAYQEISLSAPIRQFLRDRLRSIRPVPQRALSIYPYGEDLRFTAIVDGNGARIEISDLGRVDSLYRRYLWGELISRKDIIDIETIISIALAAPDEADMREYFRSQREDYVTTGKSKYYFKIIINADLEVPYKRMEEHIRHAKAYFADSFDKSCPDCEHPTKQRCKECRKPLINEQRDPRNWEREDLIAAFDDVMETREAGFADLVSADIDFERGVCACRGETYIEVIADSRESALEKAKAEFEAIKSERYFRKPTSDYKDGKGFGDLNSISGTEFVLVGFTPEYKTKSRFDKQYVGIYSRRD